MSTITVLASELQPHDRIDSGLGFLGPFIATVEVSPVVTIVRTVNGGQQVWPSVSRLAVVRGQVPTGDPGEGY